MTGHLSLQDGSSLPKKPTTIPNDSNTEPIF